MEDCMRIRRLIWVFVVVLIALTGAWTYAQSLQVTPVTPTVVSGPDLGFRVVGNRGGTPVGTLVIKMNGQWVEVEIGGDGRPKRITSR
jgi:hypothetical protein